MSDVRDSDTDHHLVLDVPNVVARHIRDMCREREADADTIAAESRYGGLANMIDRELSGDTNE